MYIYTEWYNQKKKEKVILKITSKKMSRKVSERMELKNLSSTLEIKIMAILDRFYL